MKKGFTIIELLVASLLLGMLVTILTMIFNQSSIAWRTGVSTVTDLDEARNDIALIREQADNAIIVPEDNGNVHYLTGLWRENGELKNRACDKHSNWSEERYQELKIPTSFAFPLDENSLNSISIGSSDSSHNYKNYTVNVMSGGPANDIYDWQAIWSFPDDPSEW